MNRRVDRTQQVGIYEQFKSKIKNIDVRRIGSWCSHRWSELSKFHQVSIIGFSVFVVVLFFLPQKSTPAIHVEPLQTERKPIDISTTGLSEQGPISQKASLSKSWKDYTVKSGDTLAQVFRSNDLPMTDLNALVQIEGTDKPLSQIRAGQLIRFKLDDEGQLDILQLEKKPTSVMFFRLSDGGFARNK